jgi:hypothetical protein
LVCTIGYEAKVVDALKDVVTIDNTKRTLTITATKVSLASDTAYDYVITPKDGAGTKKTGVDGSQKIIIKDVCSPPKTTVATATDASSIQLGSTDDVSITFKEWTYTTDPADQKCTLTYAFSAVPQAISAAVACDDSTRICKATASKITDAMKGAHTLTMTGKGADTKAIADKKTDVVFTVKSKCDPPKTVTAPTVTA